MADAKDRFQEIFGIDVTKKVSDAMYRIQVGAVRAKLAEFAAEAEGFRIKLEAIAAKYADGALAVGYAEATRDLEQAAGLDASFASANEVFQDAVRLANGCQFKVETEIKYYLPTAALDRSAVE